MTSTLHKYILSHQWTEAQNALACAEGAIAAKCSDDHGRLPLHNIFGYKKAPEDLVLRLIASNPNASKIADNDKLLPLHHATLYGASPSIVTELLINYPEALETKNAFGDTPRDLARMGCLDLKSRDLLKKTVSYWATFERNSSQDEVVDSKASALKNVWNSFRLQSLKIPQVISNNSDDQLSIVEKIPNAILELEKETTQEEGIIQMEDEKKDEEVADCILLGSEIEGTKILGENVSDVVTTDKSSNLHIVSDSDESLDIVPEREISFSTKETQASIESQSDDKIRELEVKIDDLQVAHQESALKLAEAVIWNEDLRKQNKLLEDRLLRSEAAYGRLVEELDKTKKMCETNSSKFEANEVRLTRTEDTLEQVISGQLQSKNSIESVAMKLDELDKKVLTSTSDMSGIKKDVALVRDSLHYVSKTFDEKLSVASKSIVHTIQATFIQEMREIRSSMAVCESTNALVTDLKRQFVSVEQGWDEKHKTMQRGTAMAIAKLFDSDV